MFIMHICIFMLHISWSIELETRLTSKTQTNSQTQTIYFWKTRKSNWYLFEVLFRISFHKVMDTDMRCKQISLWGRISWEILWHHRSIDEFRIHRKNTICGSLLFCNLFKCWSWYLYRLKKAVYYVFCNCGLGMSVCLSLRLWGDC